MSTGSLESSAGRLGRWYVICFTFDVSKGSTPLINLCTSVCVGECPSLTEKDTSSSRVADDGQPASVRVYWCVPFDSVVPEVLRASSPQC